MPKNTVDFQKQKKKRTAKKLIKKLRIPLVILIAVMIFSIIYAASGEVRRSNTADIFRAIPKTFGTSRGFPYNEDELSLDKVMLIGDKPLIVSETGVEVISQAADELLLLRTEWSDSRVCSQNGRALVYSNTSDKVFLISRTTVLAELKEEGFPVTACLADNGSFALTYSTDNVQTVVKVYNPRQKLEFEWHCSKEYVSSVALSPDGKTLFVAAVGVDNAEIYTRLLLFKTDKSEPKFDVKIEDTAMLKVFRQTGNKYIAVGDNKTVILTHGGKIKQEITYADDALYTVDSDSKNNVLLCYKEFGGSKIKIIKIPKSGSENRELEIDYLPSSIDIKGNEIACALADTVKIYSASGREKDSYTCAQDVGTVLISNTGIYTLENGSICKYQR